MMDLRETRASSYTIKDTPTFTEIMHPVKDVLDLLEKPPSSILQKA